MSIRAKNVVIGKNSKNYGTIVATDSVTIASGGIGDVLGAITAPTVTIASGGTNAGAIIGDLIVNGVNSGAVTGTITVNSGGNNSGNATVDIIVNGTGINTGTVGNHLTWTTSVGDRYTAAGVTDLAGATIYSNTALTVNYPFGNFTYNSVKYATDGSGLCNSYESYVVSDDTNGNVLYSIVGYNPSTDLLYTDKVLATTYTGYYYYSSTPYYVEAGAQQTYRKWLVSNDSNSGSLYTALTAGDITTQTVNTDSTLTSAYTGRFDLAGLVYYSFDGASNTADEYYSFGHYGLGELITSTNLTTPTDIAIDDALWYTYSSGVATLASGAYTNYYFTTPGVIDTSLTNAGPYESIDSLGNYYGYTAGVAYSVDPPILHNYSLSYNGTTYYHDAEFGIVNGTVIYSYGTTNALATSATFYIGTDGEAGYSKVETDNVTAAATVTEVIHSAQVAIGGSSYYYDPADGLYVGKVLYTGTYTMATNSSAISGYIGTLDAQGYGYISVAGYGVIDAYYLIDHQYNYGPASSYNSDDSPLTNASVLYTGRYTHYTANNIEPFYTGSEGSDGYSLVSTNGSGVVTLTPVNHQYSFSGYYADYSSLSNGYVLYTGPYTAATANNVVFYTGIEGSYGYTRNTTNGSGVVTVTVINHLNSGSHSGGTYYYNSLSSGETAYTGQYTDNVASLIYATVGTDGSEGYGTLTTNNNGVMTVTYVDHSNSITIGSVNYFYSGTLGISTYIYTGRYTNNQAATSGYSEGYYWNTSSQPVYGPFTQVSATATCNVGGPGSLYITGTNLGDHVLSDSYQLKLNDSFAYSGNLYGTDYNGAIATKVACNAYN